MAGAIHRDRPFHSAPVDAGRLPSCQKRNPIAGRSFPGCKAAIRSDRPSSSQRHLSKIAIGWMMCPGGLRAAAAAVPALEKIRIRSPRRQQSLYQGQHASCRCHPVAIGRRNRIHPSDQVSEASFSGGRRPRDTDYGRRPGNPAASTSWPSLQPRNRGHRRIRASAASLAVRRVDSSVGARMPCKAPGSTRRLPSE